MTWLDDITLDTVIVHQRDGMSIKGVKAAVHEDCVILRDAAVLQGDGITTLLGGEILIPRENVAFMQLVTVEEITS